MSQTRVAAMRKTLAAGKPGGAYVYSSACSVAPRVAPERLMRWLPTIRREKRSFWTVEAKR